MSDSEMSEFASIVERIERGEVPMRNIERELLCPVCKELFTHPLVLPCQHSVCHRCVKELLMPGSEEPDNTPTHSLMYCRSGSGDMYTGSDSSGPGSPRTRVPSPGSDRLTRAGTYTQICIVRLLSTLCQHGALCPAANIYSFTDLLEINNIMLH
ncbi:hypothetical protein DNTS_004413 [Danionella cerebrum]|uniref:RING-type domain-containing protein n=1 Tax=Danionella cerebrum TaxID=2873325 RepID=A0A553NH89_9TELE|nr:hypothetical protein DNTS_004413 [Danionella translucida]